MAIKVNSTERRKNIMEKSRFEVYLSMARDWRWRIKAVNGEIVAVSSEGYSTKQGAINSVQWMRINAPSSAVIVL